MVVCDDYNHKTARQQRGIMNVNDLNNSKKMVISKCRDKCV